MVILINYKNELKGKLSKIWSWIKGSGVVAELTPEEREKIIESISCIAKNNGMEIPFTLFLETIRPVSYIFSNLVILPSVPILKSLGISGYRYVRFFEKPENLELLLDKIEEGAREK